MEQTETDGNGFLLTFSIAYGKPNQNQGVSQLKVSPFFVECNHFVTILKFFIHSEPV